MERFDILNANKDELLEHAKRMADAWKLMREKERQEIIKNGCNQKASFEKALKCQKTF